MNDQGYENEKTNRESRNVLQSMFAMLMKENDNLSSACSPHARLQEDPRGKSRRAYFLFFAGTIGRLPDGNTQYSADCFRWDTNGESGR